MYCQLFYKSERLDGICHVCSYVERKSGASLPIAAACQHKLVEWIPLKVYKHVTSAHLKRTQTRCTGSAEDARACQIDMPQIRYEHRLVLSVPRHVHMHVSSANIARIHFRINDQQTLLTHTSEKITGGTEMKCSKRRGQGCICVTCQSKK